MADQIVTLAQSAALPAEFRGRAARVVTVLDAPAAMRMQDKTTWTKRGGRYVVDVDGVGRWTVFGDEFTA